MKDIRGVSKYKVVGNVKHDTFFGTTKEGKYDTFNEMEGVIFLPKIEGPIFSLNLRKHQFQVREFYWKKKSTFVQKNCLES